MNVLSLLALGLAVSASAPNVSDRPNVVLIVADDLGRDLGCYGNAKVRTPNVDAIAADGTRFANAFCTTASCSASRSVILSGQHNHANGQYGHQHSVHKFSSFETVKSLPVRMSDAGYRTARAGKYHVAPESVYRFDQTIGEGGRPAALARKCESFLKESKEKPFFLYFCTTEPHRSGQTAAELPNKPNRFGNPPQGRDNPNAQETIYDPKDVIVPPFLPDTPTCRAELAQYYQAISRMDQGVGELIAILKRNGVWDNTIVIFISDNGIPMPAAKTNLYDSGMRLPCVVRDPRAPQAKRGIVSEAMITWADIAPTVLDFAGALTRDAIRTFHGQSFAHIIGETNPEGWDRVFASHTFHEITMYYPMRVVRDRKYKLIWNIAHPLPFPFASDLWSASTWQAQLKQGPNAPYGKRTVARIMKRPQFELYDLESDPDEIANLADKPEHAAKLEELKGLIKSFQERTKDPWLSKWEYE